MGINESSLTGCHQTTTESSFTVRATDYTTFPVKTKGGSPSTFAARGPDYSNFPFHPKGSSSVVRSNSSSFGYSDNNSTTLPPPQGKSSGVMAFHSSAQWKTHFDAAKDTDKLMVIGFTATWCGSCKSMDAVINDFAAKYTYVEFIKIDVDELHDVAMKYQVVTVPTFLLMKKGKVVGKVVGANKDQLKAKIEHCLF